MTSPQVNLQAKKTRGKVARLVTSPGLELILTSRLVLSHVVKMLKYLKRFLYLYANEDITCGTENKTKSVTDLQIFGAQKLFQPSSLPENL